MKKLNIYFVKVDDVAKETVIKTSEEVFNFEVKARDLDVDLSFAWNNVRKQLNADMLLRWAMIKLSKIFLLIVPDDIYVPGLNFVFGVAYPHAGAIISTWRFRSDDERIYRERISKTVKHEIGHVGGLSHCNNACVMRFANSLYELDIKPPEFCESCAKKLLHNGFLRKEYYRKIVNKI